MDRQLNTSLEMHDKTTSTMGLKQVNALKTSLKDMQSNSIHFTTAGFLVFFSVDHSMTKKKRKYPAKKVLKGNSVFFIVARNERKLDELVSNGENIT